MNQTEQTMLNLHVDTCHFVFLIVVCAGLYNVAHEAVRGAMDSHFPRLGQMIVDYEHPVRKMAEEFIPLSKVSIWYM